MRVRALSVSRPLYRARQFLGAVTARVSEDERREVRALLREGEYALFLSMEACDQRHGIDVMRRVRSAGRSDRDLLVAALLHDCGKGRVPVWLRVEYVRNLARVEALSRRLPAPPGGGFTHEMLAGRSTAAAAYRLVHHARIGAALAERAGAAPATVRLISGIVSSDGEAEALRLLQAADDAS